MDWNIGNSCIAIACVVLAAISIGGLFKNSTSTAARYLNWFFIAAALTILQVILIDARVTREYPAVYLAFVPWEFLAPVFFSAFTCSYLDRMWEFKRFKKLLLIPFVIFFIIYIVLKINAIMGYSLFTIEVSSIVTMEWDENLAVLFGLVNAIWNYRIIKKYEKRLFDLSFGEVLRKTYWLRVMYTAQVALLIMWVLVIVYLKITRFERSMDAYYPLWFLFLGFYFVFFVLAQRHLKMRVLEKKRRQEAFQEILADFQVEGLNHIFSKKELREVLGGTTEVTGILSYFATSLFDKSNEDAVLWDVVRNCISQLGLEDCVIYILDEERQVLVQKAAYGNKDLGSRKILSPIEIPVHSGIVGAVAASRQWELVNDVTIDDRYVKDDLQRKSELAVPIIYDNTLFGVLDSENGAKDFFEERHILLFKLVAKLTATKLNQISKKESLTITNDNGYYKELCLLIEKEKIFRDPDLNLNKTAGRLNISNTYLSQLVNKLSGMNFSDYINTYRVKDAQRLLTHPNYSSYPILSIGLEAGFNSKSTFYAAFKKHTDVTPSVYRANAPYPS